MIYHYCDYRTSGRQNNRAITDVAASLLIQLLENEPAIPLVVENMYAALRNGRDRLKLDDMMDILQQLCSAKKTGSPVHIVLDALDEYSPSSQQPCILSLLRTLVEISSAKVLITSRMQLLDKGMILSMNCVQLEIRSNRADIHAFVEHTISTSPELFEIIGTDRRDEVVDRIVEQSGDM